MEKTIPQFFSGQTVLVTGAAGFMGKVLVEKILRACPDVAKIFILIREKKGKTAQERWDSCTELPLFDKLKSMRPEALKKVVVVPGDLTYDDIGLSDQNKKMLIEETTLVYHGAAMVQFGDIVTDALLSNAKGTYLVANLTKSMKNLKVFVYISSAYSNYDRPSREAIEEILPCCQDWRVLLKLLDREPQALNFLKEKLQCGHPNLYTWSKSISEQIVDSFKEYYPVVVMRPAIVSGCLLDDPLVGWTDALTGTTAVVSAFMLGVLRVHCTDPNSHLDYIFVDIATRAIMIATKKAVCKNERISVYNCAIGEQFKVSVKDIMTKEHALESFISKNIVWPPHAQIHQNMFLYKINFFIKQVIPAVILDGILKVTGKPTMLVKVCKKLANTIRIFKPFLFSYDMFPIKRYMELENEVLPEDKELFTIEVSEHLNENCLYNQMYGTFKYYYKEDLLDEEQKKKNLKRYRRLVIARYAWIVVQHCAIAWLVSLAIL